MKKLFATLLLTGLLAGLSNAKPLVAYFSATGNTERLARTAAKTLNADLFEIVPEQKYTDADLDWTDKKSRTTLESNDKKARPAIKNKVELAQYDSVVVAFPIWWYTAPKIIYTFMESYDFGGKKIVLLCTSGGSGLGRTSSDLQKVTNPKADIRNGKCLSPDAGEFEIRKVTEKALR